MNKKTALRNVLNSNLTTLFEYETSAQIFCDLFKEFELLCRIYWLSNCEQLVLVGLFQN